MRNSRSSWQILWYKDTGEYRYTAADFVFFGLIVLPGGLLVWSATCVLSYAIWRSVSNG